MTTIKTKTTSMDLQKYCNDQLIYQQVVDPSKRMIDLYKIRMSQDYQHITSAMVDEHMKNIWESMQPGMTRKHFQAFAAACQQIEKGIKDLHIPMPDHYREQIMELVTARIALVCASHNERFDSFQFYAAARGENARRGISEKTGSAARSSTRASKRSKP